MAQFSHRGHTAFTAGDLPKIGSKAPAFRLTGTDMKDVRLADFAGTRLVLNIFPSLDTSTCAASVRRFNQLASALTNTKVLCISKDLPFAQRRFCGAEGITNVVCLSQFRDTSFSDHYNVDITSGSTLLGLMARAIVVIDETGVVLYTELVADIGSEPDYDAALKSLA